MGYFLVWLLDSTFTFPIFYDSFYSIISPPFPLLCMVLEHLFMSRQAALFLSLFRV